eukprot:1723011-Prymnesium_polylepis.1
MTAMLKKDAKSTPEAWEGVRQSFEAIMMFLKSDAVVSAPDLREAMAEYVICTGACDVAAGGVLLQWQHPSGKGPHPPNGMYRCDVTRTAIRSRNRGASTTVIGCAPSPTT